jgi:Zn-dependent peptidase ImmA (M78 family)
MDSIARKQLVLKAAAQAEYVRMRCSINRLATVDPIWVAKQRGCEVRYMSLPSLEGVYSTAPRPVIILGSERPAGRRVYTCMHELGHHEFGHGMRVDELKSGEVHTSKDPDEFLADMFAATLLMSQASIRHSLKARGFDTTRLEPMQVFRLASFFGVGYSTLIDHMTLTLGLLSLHQRVHLKKIVPKELKAQFGCAPQSEVVLTDEFWLDRAVDMEIGDILVLHRGAIVEDNPRISQHGVIDGQPTFRAVSRGYLRAFHKNNDWAVNIRIAPKQYEGLAHYRFLDDPEEAMA